MKKFSFTNKNVILTGASSGMGKSIAHTLIEKYNCTVYAIAKIEAELISAKDEMADNREKFIIFPFDAGVHENWINFAHELEKTNTLPDVLINCAGILPKFSSVEKTEIDLIESVLKTNFLSQVYSSKIFLPIIKKRADGAIINFSSSASLCPFAGVGAYCASKSASERFTECLAQESKNVLVSVVIPGFIRTNIMRAQSSTEKESNFIYRISADCDKTVKKILMRICKRKKRIIVGKDAHFLNFIFKFFPNSAPKIISMFLKKSGFSTFEDI